LCLPAAAHNLAPSYLELREGVDGRVAVSWKQPLVVPRGVRLAPRLPCADASPPRAQLRDDAVIADWELACDGALVGREVVVDGLAGSGSDAILRIALADGREVRAILTAAQPSLRIPARERAASVLGSYARLGAEHLASGPDHLLFVAGLVLLLGATRRLAYAVTAFTAGHSVTLALAALGLVAFPQALVEIGIAASLVALALQLAREPLPAEGATRGDLARRPLLLPFAFGLLHGLGFAGALGALGLPQHAIPLALFAFNVGIELGQLAFVALLLAVAFALAPVTRTARASARSVFARALAELPATAIGGFGVFWCLERAAGWLFP
jgi:hypothetical protein